MLTILHSHQKTSETSPENPKYSISHVMYQLQEFLQGHLTVDSVHACVSACVCMCAGFLELMWHSGWPRS